MTRNSAGSSELLIGYGRQGYNVTQGWDGPIPIEAVEELFAWNAVEVPIVALHNNTTIAIPGRKALVNDRLGVVLGTPSERYAPHQYSDSLLGGVKRILGSDGLAINAAGYTGFGAKAWISVSLADTVCTPEGVEFLPYIAAIGSHDSTIATSYKRSALNMICNNQIGALRRENRQQTVKVRHTSGSILHLENAQQALAVLVQTEDEFSRQIRELCEEEVTRKQWDDFVKAYSPIPAEDGRAKTLAENKQGHLQSLYASDARCAPWAGTAFGVLQTVNTYQRHVATVQGTDRQERNLERDLTNYWDDLDLSTLQALHASKVSA